MVHYQNLRTVKQIAADNPILTEGKLRWMVFNASKNGLATALVRVGGRVYVDVAAFNAWLEARRQESMPDIYRDAV